MVFSFQNSCRRQLTLPVNKRLKVGSVIVKMKRGTVLRNLWEGKQRVVDVLEGARDPDVRVILESGPTEITEDTKQTMRRLVETQFKMFRGRNE